LVFQVALSYRFSKKIMEFFSASKVPGALQWLTQHFFSGVGGGGEFTPEIFSEWGLTNSVEGTGHREWGSGSGSPLVSGFTQFANE
jgi:hypothetical protein